MGQRCSVVKWCACVINRTAFLLTIATNDHGKWLNRFNFDVFFTSTATKLSCRPTLLTVRVWLCVKAMLILTMLYSTNVDSFGCVCETPVVSTMAIYLEEQMFCCFVSFTVLPVTVGLCDFDEANV